MKNIIVFGGTGFIGKNLVNQLINYGHRVVVIDNLSTSSYDELNHQATFRFGDVTDRNMYQHLAEYIASELDGKVDEIYNLACPASPPKYQIDPLKTIDTCLAVRYIAEMAIHYDAKLMHSSTSEVYGDPDEENHPQPETYWGNVNPVGPRSCYDEGKRIAETILMEMHHKKGLKLKLIRIFNTYGPYMDIDDGRVVTNFIKQALYGDPLTIYGDGTQTRSFQYIDDLVKRMLILMDTDYEVQPVNIGTIFEINMLKLANMILELTGSNSEIVFKELPKDDPRQRQADTTLLNSLTGYTKSVDVREGLIKTIAYFKSRLL